MGHRKVSGAADYIIPIGIVGIAAFALYKFGLFSGGGSGTGGNNAAQSGNVATAAQQAFTQSSTTIPQSIPDTQLNSMIGIMLNDASENTSIFSGSSYQEDIVNQVSLLNNITDLYRLISLWGTRAVPTSQFTLCNTLDLDCSTLDFGTFLKVTLTADQLSEVNNDLAGNGINYSFS
jgi:hypothetical protein